MNSRMRNRRRWQTVGVNVLAWALSLILMAPLLLILVNSFKDSVSASDMNLALPTSPQWSNYSVVVEKGKLLKLTGRIGFDNRTVDWFEVCTKGKKLWLSVWYVQRYSDGITIQLYDKDGNKVN